MKNMKYVCLRNIYLNETMVAKNLLKILVNVCCILSRVQLFYPPGSSVHGISQARILEWIAISFSKGYSQPRDQNWVFPKSCIAHGFFTTEPLEKLKILG